MPLFSHVMLGSNDLERSRIFYDAVLAVLGLPPGQDNRATTGTNRLIYSDGSDTFLVSQPLDGERATPANGATLGFACASPGQVRELHDVAVAHGGTTIEDPPGLRHSSRGPVHLSYFRDPDGNKLCGLMRPE